MKSSTGVTLGADLEIAITANPVNPAINSTTQITVTATNTGDETLLPTNNFECRPKEGQQ